MTTKIVLLHGLTGGRHGDRWWPGTEAEPPTVGDAYEVEDGDATRLFDAKLARLYDPLIDDKPIVLAADLASLQAALAAEIATRQAADVAAVAALVKKPEFLDVGTTFADVAALDAGKGNPPAGSVWLAELADGTMARNTGSGWTATGGAAADRDFPVELAADSDAERIALDASRLVDGDTARYGGMMWVWTQASGWVGQADDASQPAAEVTQAELDIEIARLDALEASQTQQDTDLATKVALTTETDARTAADGTLSGRIDTLESSQGTQDTAISTKADTAALTAEATTRGNADAALDGRTTTLETSQTAQDVAIAANTTHRNDTKIHVPDQTGNAGKALIGNADPSLPATWQTLPLYGERQFPNITAADTAWPTPTDPSDWWVIGADTTLGAVPVAAGGRIMPATDTGPWTADTDWTYFPPPTEAVELTQAQVEDPDDTNYGVVSGQRLRQAIDVAVVQSFDVTSNAATLTTTNAGSWTRIALPVPAGEQITAGSLTATGGTSPSIELDDQDLNLVLVRVDDNNVDIGYTTEPIPPEPPPTTIDTQIGQIFGISVDAPWADWMVPLSGGTYNYADSDMTPVLLAQRCAGAATDNGDGTFTVDDWNGEGRFLRGGDVAGVEQADATAVNGLRALRTYVQSDWNGQSNNDFGKGSGSSVGAANNSTGLSGDTETRPINVSVVWVLQVKAVIAQGDVTINNTIPVTLVSITANAGAVTVNGAASASMPEGTVAQMRVAVPDGQMIDTITGADLLNAEAGFIAVERADGSGDLDVTVTFAALPVTADAIPPVVVTGTGASTASNTDIASFTVPATAKYAVVMSGSAYNNSSSASRWSANFSIEDTAGGVGTALFKKYHQLQNVVQSQIGRRFAAGAITGEVDLVAGVDYWFRYEANTGRISALDEWQLLLIPIVAATPTALDPALVAITNPGVNGPLIYNGDGTATAKRQIRGVHVHNGSTGWVTITYPDGGFAAPPHLIPVEHILSENNQSQIGFRNHTRFGFDYLLRDVGNGQVPAGAEIHYTATER